ncbi:MAG: hypothetical protein ABI882_19565 [Acidobacteriota bacterium]
MIRKISILTTSALIVSALTLSVLAQTSNKKAEKAEQKTARVEQKVEQKSAPIAESNDKVTVTIQNVTKNDAAAKKAADGKSRNVPVTFTWLCGSQGNAKLAELQARLITLNTDGSQTNVSKKLVDWSVNTPINSQIDLPMPEGVFAKSFTLTLVGKFKKGAVDQLVSISTVKSGSFPLVGK